MLEYKIKRSGGGQPKPLLYSINENGCWINESHATTKHGYGKITINRKTILIHRYVYEQENNVSLGEDDVVMHLCDNPRCFNPCHLKLGTQKDNMIDKKNKNRTARNEEHGRAKLSNQDVINIFHDKRTQQTIATDYNVSQYLISLIKNKKIHNDILENE